MGGLGKVEGASFGKVSLFIVLTHFPQLNAHPYSFRLILGDLGLVVGCLSAVFLSSKTVGGKQTD